MREIVEDLLGASRLEATTDEAPMAPWTPELLNELVRDSLGNGAAAIRARHRRQLHVARQRPNFIRSRRT
jgi:hypothetical protein